jgi:hypothetical protein
MDGGPVWPLETPGNAREGWKGEDDLGVMAGSDNHVRCVKCRGAVRGEQAALDRRANAKIVPSSAPSRATGAQRVGWL